MNSQRTLIVAVAAAVTLTAVGGVVALTSGDISGPPAATGPETPTPGDEGIGTPVVSTDGTADNKSTPTTENDSGTAATDDLTEPYYTVTGDQPIRLEAAPEQVLRGQTDLAAGETVDVQLVTQNGAANPFVRTVTTTVDADGSFRTAIDLSGAHAGTPFNVTVVHDGTEIVTTSGVVIEGPATAQNETDEKDIPRFRVDGERLTLDAAPNQTVAGTTTLDAGTTVSVRLQSTGGGQAFIMMNETTIGDDGRFDASFNLSAITPGTAFEASVYHDGETVVSTDGIVED